MKDGKTFKPSGDTRIDEGNVIAIFAMADDVSEVERLLQVSIDFF
jgi:trk system potassium uptake protein TrkA